MNAANTRRVVVHNVFRDVDLTQVKRIVGIHSGVYAVTGIGTCGSVACDGVFFTPGAVPGSCVHFFNVDWTKTIEAMTGGQ